MEKNVILWQQYDLNKWKITVQILTSCFYSHTCIIKISGPPRFQENISQSLPLKGYSMDFYLYQTLFLPIYYIQVAYTHFLPVPCFFTYVHNYMYILFLHLGFSHM